MDEHDFDAKALRDEAWHFLAGGRGTHSDRRQPGCAFTTGDAVSSFRIEIRDRDGALRMLDIPYDHCAFYHAARNGDIYVAVAHQFLRLRGGIAGIHLLEQGMSEDILCRMANERPDVVAETKNGRTLRHCVHRCALPDAAPELRQPKQNTQPPCPRR
ncbi:MAG: hypothetical protein KGI97_04165 [Alphaproteobacteria bacterium]|nr:hypothetical protein [Alphaproteobacteria bacterium]